MRKLGKTLRQWSEPEGATRWLLGGPMRRLSPWARVVKRDMERSQAIDIIAAYFAPSPAMLRRLDKAGKRGQVRLVLPSKLDHGAAIWAARFTYAGLLRKRVQIYEYQPTKLHTKLFVTDDVVHIGSANFDIRSMFLNLELMFRIEDPASPPMSEAMSRARSPIRSGSLPISTGSAPGCGHGSSRLARIS